MSKNKSENKNTLHCNLTQLQEQYLPAIEWLVDLDSYRRQGRTYTMAVAFIMAAMKRPGVMVEVWDHVSRLKRDFELGQRWIMEEIERILSLPENKEILKRTTLYRDGLKIEGFWPKKIEAEWIGRKSPLKDGRRGF